MAFIIDTGPVDHGPLRLVPDWFIDQCPDHGDVARVCRAYAEHLVGQMSGPAKLDTVRKHLAAALPFPAGTGRDRPGGLRLDHHRIRRAVLCRRLRIRAGRLPAIQRPIRANRQRKLT